MKENPSTLLVPIIKYVIHKMFLHELKGEDVAIGDPKEGEIRVKNKAIGVNFIDIYFRTRVYKVPEFPYTPGVEAVGVVTAVGTGVEALKIGDVVYHSGSAMGTYTEEQIVLADKAIHFQVKNSYYNKTLKY